MRRHFKNNNSENIMRSTKYNDEVLAKTKDYLHNYEKYDHLFPSIVGLSSVLGIAKSTISSWKHDDDKQEFSDTLEQIKDQQHLTLLNKGLTGEFNASITKLMLHNFGYSDKQKIQSDQSDMLVVKLRTNFDEPIDFSQYTNEELDAIIAEGEK